MSSVAPSFCVSCGSPLGSDELFCGKCGTRASAASPAPAQAEPVAALATPPAPPAEQQAPAAASSVPLTAHQVTLLSAGPYRARVLMALRQVLGLSPRDAAAYMTAAPVLLAVGVAPDTAERLRAALVSAGAVVQVQGPPPSTVTAVEDRPPKPVPARSCEVRARTTRDLPERRGARTVSGLCLGRGFSYVSFSRVEGQRIMAPPDLVRFDGHAMVPTAIRLAGKGSPESFGADALASWPSSPEDVLQGFTAEFGGDDGRAAEALKGFLKSLSYRLVDVLGPGAVSDAEGASTNLSVPADWTAEQVGRLGDIVLQAGFPLARLVPEPLAAFAHHLRIGTLKNVSGPSHCMIIDWGSQGLGISFVESGAHGEDPVIFDHQELALGGIWFDMIVQGWLVQRLQVDLSDEDQRALALFSRDFKEEASRTFSEGRAEHVQYSVIPAGLPPTRISFTRAEADELFKDAQEQFKTAVAESLSRIGFEPEHLDHVIVAGGGGRWYFVREVIRASLGRVPLISPNPEETIPLGLAVYGLAETTGKR